MNLTRRVLFPFGLVAIVACGGRVDLGHDNGTNGLSENSGVDASAGSATSDAQASGDDTNNDGGRGASGLSGDDGGSALGDDDGGAGAGDDDEPGPYEPSKFRGLITINRFGNEACGILLDATISCWGSASPTPAIGGTFLTIVQGTDSLCGVRSTGELACFGGPTPPLGDDYTRVVISEMDGRVCGLSAAGDIRCNASNGVSAQNLTGPYIDLATNNDAVCGLRSNGVASCMGFNGASVTAPTAMLAQFQLVESTIGSQSGAPTSSCGLSTDGKPTCSGTSLTSASTFTEVSFESNGSDSTKGSYCGISGGDLSCFKFAGASIVAPSGVYEHVVVTMALGASSLFACTIDSDGRGGCFNLDGTASAPAIGSPSDSLSFAY